MITKLIKKEHIEIVKKLFMLSSGMLLALFVLDANAATVGDLAENVTKTFKDIAELITATSYVAGLGFAVGAVLKFKQHKDNPTQIPIGTPVAMLGVAAALLFLPTVLESAGESIFGAETSTGGVKGVADIGE